MVAVADRAHSNDLYAEVPKSFEANMLYRLATYGLGYDSEEHRRNLWIACSRDPLFWVNTFVFAYDPREEGCEAGPFITYEFQDKAFLGLCKTIGKHDLLIEKSRDMGASWLCLLAILHRWLFRRHQSFMLISRKEDLVDKTDNPDCLMWKLLWALDKQPTWLTPRFTKTHLHLFNHDMGSVIDGESTTGDVGRGGRRTAILLDEFASVENGYEVLSATRDNTRSRIMPSTPKGAGNAFYDKAHDDRTPKMAFHWPQHPLKNGGLYYEESATWTRPSCECCVGKVGKPRSVWYDEQCDRAGHPMEIAQELDIDYHGSDFEFFDPGVLDERIRCDAIEPFAIGELEINSERCRPLRFTAGSRGPLSLWINMDVTGTPPIDRHYVIGADIAAGSRDEHGKGYSNSVASVVDLSTGEQCALYVVSGVSIFEFARNVVSLCKWFAGKDGDGAFLIWESNGPGENFTNAVLDAGFRNIYYRDKEDEIGKPKTRKPGWYATGRSKPVLFEEYREAVNTGKIKNMSIHSLREHRFYKRTMNGNVVHSKSEDSIDPSGARHNHGDRVVAIALACRGMRDFVRSVANKDGKVSHDVPEFSFAGRRQRRVDARQEVSRSFYPVPRRERMTA